MIYTGIHTNNEHDEKIVEVGMRIRSNACYI